MGHESNVTILCLNATGNVGIGLDSLKRNTKYAHFWDLPNTATEGTCTTASSASQTTPMLAGCHCKRQPYYAQGIQTKAMPRCFPPTVNPDHCAIGSPRLLLSIHLLHKVTHRSCHCLLHCHTHCQTFPHYSCICAARLFFAVFTKPRTMSLQFQPFSNCLYTAKSVTRKKYFCFQWDKSEK